VNARFQSKWANRAARLGITVAAAGVFFLIRPDIYGYTTDHLRSDYRMFVSKGLIADYMRQTAKPKLQIGAGANNAAGWLNTDIEPTVGQAYVDATKTLPFPDRSLYDVFGEQVIEHLTYDEGLGFMKEAHRVLVPGGKLRLVTPNLLSFVALFGDQKPEGYMPRKLDFHVWRKDTADPACLIMNGEMRSWGHQFVYTPKMMRASLEKAGFTDIRQYATGQTDDPDLRMVEVRARTDWSDLNAFDSMAFEATR
jgi:predicted SAM-dependent methyltransferase